MVFRRFSHIVYWLPAMAVAADLQQELHHVEARIHSLVKERASLQHALNTPATGPQLSPEEARAEAEERRAAQKKEVRRFEQQVARSKEALAKRQRDLDVLLADDRARLADEVALGAGAYYGETRKMRQALHEQQQQQQLGGAAGAPARPKQGESEEELELAAGGQP